MSDHPPLAMAGRVRRLEQLLVDRGVLRNTDIEATLDHLLATRTPTGGARVVARAWLDQDFCRRASENGNRALAELGLAMSDGDPPDPILRVVVNDEHRHNLVVCTVCSCYPVGLIGPSPTWYASEAYRSQAVRRPRDLLAELGLALDADVHIDVWDATSDVRYLVIPRRPEATRSLGEEELATLVTRRGMIGTALI